ncbi:uncharacterized protein ACR2FA_006160 [Aphomia sociella]
MSSVQEEWSEEKCIQLIHEFRNRPILWNQKDPFFYKKSMKSKFWEEIGLIFNTPADICKHKIQILMSSFRREKAKIIHGIKNGKEKSKSTWFAFKELAFLMDKETERKRQLTGADEVDDDTPSLKKILLKHHLQPPISKTVSQTPVAINNEISKMMTQPSIEIPITRTILEPTQPTAGPSRTITESDEEIKSFANFITIKMKKYTETTKNAVQQEICNIIFKADQGYFEKCYEKITIIDSETDPLDKIGRYEIENITKTEQDSDNSD